MYKSTFSTSLHKHIAQLTMDVVMPYDILQNFHILHLYMLISTRKAYGQ